MDYADKYGYVTTYYGTYNPNKPRKHKVHHFMIEEYIRQAIEKEKEEFKVDMKRILEDFSKSITKKLTNDKFTNMADDTRKMLNAIIVLNSLEKPIEKKARVNAINKSEIEDVDLDEEDGDDEL